MSLVISVLRQEEIEAAVALWDEAGLLRPWNDPRADIALALGKPSSSILSGEMEGVLAATAMVGSDGHRGWVYYLAVAKNHRRKGLGTAMMRAAEDWCRVHDTPKLHVMIRNENKSISDFYASLGYVLSDTIVMAKALAV